MERKSIVIILSLALTVSFFFPIFDMNFFGMSGPNYILSSYTPSYKYLLLFIPFVSICVFLAASYSENFVFTLKLISWIPLFALMLVFILSCFELGFGNTFSKLDIGFWMTLIFSLLLGLALVRKNLSERATMMPNMQS